MYHLGYDFLFDGRDIRHEIVYEYFFRKTIYSLLYRRDLLNDVIAVSARFAHLLDTFQLSDDPVDTLRQFLVHLF